LEKFEFDDVARDVLDLVAAEGEGSDEADVGRHPLYLVYVVET
jgi:hypothetical protein